MKDLNVIYSESYLKYDLGEGNPISRTKTTNFLRLIKDGDINYQIIEGPPANEDDLLLVHTSKYLAELKRLAESNLEYDPDTPVNRGMLEGGLYIVGGTMLCLEMALEGKRVVNLIGGMHHAGSYQASGFCIYNDHAIAIRKLQSEGKIKTATIYDLDVHAGQGTQEIFYEDPTVLTVSMHQDPHSIYPGVGFEGQRGTGLGSGFNINIPLPPGANEEQYMKALDAVLERTMTFSSDLNILVLGVDTYKDDLLGGLKLQEDSFRKIGERFRKFEKLAVLFGGGYSNKIPELWMSFLTGYLE